MRLIVYLPNFLFFSNINVIPFKIVPLGNYPPMETSDMDDRRNAAHKNGGKTTKRRAQNQMEDQIKNDIRMRGED